MRGATRGSSRRAHIRLALAASLIALAALIATPILRSAGPAVARTALCRDASRDGFPGKKPAHIQIGRERHRFTYHVAPGPVPRTGRPVLLWLHGLGWTGDGASGTDFFPFSDPDGAVVITPNGTNKDWDASVSDIPNHKPRRWWDGRDAPTLKPYGMTDDGRHPHDMLFLEKIFDELDACPTGVLDRSRYFVSGYSRGAYVAYYLLERPGTRDRIDAVAATMGGLYCQRLMINPHRPAIHANLELHDKGCTEESDPRITASHARILHVHGLADPIVTPPRARFDEPPGQPIKPNIDWRVFYPMNLWAQQNGCWDGPHWDPVVHARVASAADNGVLKETYVFKGHRTRLFDLSAHGRGCAKYQLVLVDHAGHGAIWDTPRTWAFLMDRPFTEAHTLSGLAQSDYVKTPMRSAAASR